MTTLSSVAANCGSRREEARVFEFGPHSYFVKDFLGCDWVRNSVKRVSGYQSHALRGYRRKRFCIIAKIGKGKKHDYPWPDDIDPNISSGHLTYLSYFKPLTEKPKPVTLPFEKPLVDLEKKIIEVRKMADETGLDFSQQIGALESKYQLALKDLYAHLTPIQRLSIARHPNRPTVLDHILNITDKWVELHGDRAGYDDPAIVTGIGNIGGKSYLFIGHQKGRNTKENIARNFAMPTPHGYRKALRLMKYADHHGLPIVTFVDTPGAFADLKSEELGQGEAIAFNLRAMFSLKVPIVTVVTGEGGSGGALAIACSNKLFMLENSAFYVASPEACAAILWKSSQAAPKAAEKLRITAQEHYRLGIADGIIPEPIGGAHADPVWTSQQIKLFIIKAMEELEKLDTEELLRHRMLKFRSIGGFQEGKPVDPERKRNMKLSDVNIPTSSDLIAELESLKNTILEAKGPTDSITSQHIEKLKQDVDQEITNAFISMGLQEKLENIKLELSSTPNDSPSQPVNHALEEKANRIIHEFKSNLSQPGAYLGLKQKLEKLSMVSRFIELKDKSEKLKVDINKRIPAEVKARVEALKKAQEKLSAGDSPGNDMLEEVKRAKEDLKEVLKSANLEIVEVTKRMPGITPPDLQQKNGTVDKEIQNEIERAILAADLGAKVEELKAETGKDCNAEKVEVLQAQIKEEIIAALDVNALEQKLNKLGVEFPSSVTTDNKGKSGYENGRVE